MKPGDIVAERYRLESKVGEGGMGTVWSARHTMTRGRVALKFLKRVGDPKMKRRFVREARAASAVRHPNVVSIFDVLELGDGTPMMVMEFLVGESLAERLARGPLPVAEVAQILLETTEAVGTAHAHGVIHRDLKPENIFLCHEASAGLVKVLDFGIAKLTATAGEAAETGGLTHTGAIVGTPYYMSPEQAFGEPLDHRSDLWSLGVIAYECLSGVLPTQRDNLGQIFKLLMAGDIPPLREVAPDVPEPLLALVDRMLSKSPDDRPRDLREVHDVLASVIASTKKADFGPAVAPRELSDTSTPHSIDSPPMHRPSPWWLALAAAAGLAIIVSVVRSQSLEPARPEPAPSLAPAPPPPPSPPAPSPSVADTTTTSTTSAARGTVAARPAVRPPPAPAMAAPSAAPATTRTGGVVEDPPF